MTSRKVCGKPRCMAIETDGLEVAPAVLLLNLLQSGIAFDNLNEALVQRRPKFVEHYSFSLLFFFSTIEDKIWDAIFCFLQSKHDI